jgi:hypothetical protein
MLNQDAAWRTEVRVTDRDLGAGLGLREGKETRHVIRSDLGQ